MHLSEKSEERAFLLQKTARRDLILIGIIVLTTCGIVLRDPDSFFEWLAQRREAQFDEILAAFVVIGIGFAIFAWRRWSDLSRQVAEYQRLQQELSALNREASRLSETDDLLQSCLSEDEANQIAIRHLEAELPQWSGAICVTTAARDLIEVKAQWGNPAIAEPTFSPESCWGLRRGRITILQANDAKLACAHIAQPAPGYAMCVPMMAQGETMGVLYLDSSPTRNGHSPGFKPLSESESRMVRTLAEHLALAVANLKLRESLRMQSIRDPLTDLHNRRYMEESLDRELRRTSRHEQPVSVLMIDVDHFKKFNDSLGHDAGDVLLQELGRLFRAQLRADDIACRYGGEEFTLILPEAGLADAVERAEQLCRLVNSIDFQYRGRPLPKTSISIGVATCPEHAAAREPLLQAADRALYRAKEEGRNRVVVA
ncbi:MAG TPA: GGDEF domain-containing protein [Bryobacteraceae bacterium]|nr:GGDEF domain-containing protein [Bryobacteraceae bacterium]